MQEHLGFLRTSSAVVKIAAWVFLFLGLVGFASLFLQNVALEQRLVNLSAAALYVLFFFLLFLIAKIADLLIKIINTIQKT